MKFTIDIKNFWTREDESLDEGIKRYLVDEVKKEIWNSIKNEVKTDLIKQIKQEISDSMKENINNVMKTMIDNDEIILSGRYSSDEPLPMKEYIQKQMNDKNNYNTPTGEIEKIAERHAKEISKRYDLLFASQLVAKLGNNGLLKEDVARLLLPVIDKEQ